MDAVEALGEIAFWLERDLAPRFKSQAFRKAAVTAGDLDPLDLADRARDGRLKGIGSRTFEVIRQAVEGEVPEYLANLRRTSDRPLVEGGVELRALLRGDLHTHSNWSDGWTPIALMVDSARRLGREYVALTDHSPRLSIANGLTAERLERQIEVVASLNEQHDDGLRVLSGIEVDILENGELDQEPKLLDRLDVVVASVHSKLRMEAPAMTERMLHAIESPRTDVLGHCTGRLVEGDRHRPESEFDAARVFAACAEHDVAVEINSRPERRDPPGRVIEIAIDAGCLFSIDTDAHAPGHLEFLDYGAERAARHGVPADRIVTTWPVGRVLEWSRSGR